MKIGINALYSMSGKYGGMQVYLENLLKMLFDIDHENTYVLFCNAKNYRKLSFENFNIKKVFCPVTEGLSLSKTIWEQTILPFQALKHKIDLLFSPAYIAPVLLRCKSVVTLHCTKYIQHPEEFGKLSLSILRILIPLSAKNCDHIITVSNCTKQEIVEAFNLSENKITVIPLAAADYFQSANKMESSIIKYGITGQYILSVASTKPHKNLKGLIEAYIKLKESEKIPQQLVLVGDKRHLLKFNWFNDNFSRWKENIIFTGIIPNNELAPLYRNAAIFVFVSKYESFGIPLLEAMSCGVPVITSSTFALPETAGGCALLANPDDPNDIADKINKLLKNENLLKNLSNIGKKYSEQFSWGKTAELTLNVFNETSYGKRN